MIPKIIHYCWFGKTPLPPLALKCIESWQKNMPDYEIKEWNESNFEISTTSYTKEAYEKKKFAFVSDYARFWALYHHGGIYLDTDVELLKSIDSLVQKGPFLAREKSVKEDNSFAMVNPGLGMACYKEHPLYREVLDYYETHHFIQNGKPNYTTIVSIVSDILAKHGLSNLDVFDTCSNITIYPTNYFCPQKGPSGKITITPNTYSIHHFAGSWVDPSQKSIIEKLWNFFHLPKTNIRKKIFHTQNKTIQ